MPIAAGIIGAPVAGGIIGALASEGDRDKAVAAQQAALQQWLKVNVPDPAQQAIELQRFKQVGTLSPQLQQQFQQSQSGLKGMQLDPSSRAAEMQALTQMQNIGQKGGLDAQALQQEQQAINAANTNEQGQRGAIEQNFAARGIGGSGVELAAQLQAQQGDANQAAAGGMSAASTAQQRALQAMSGAGSLGSSLNNQDYNQAANAATAQDSINRFNTQSAQGTSNANVGIQNDAQKYNLGAAQDIANRNTGVANQQEIHNKGLYQQQFDDQAKVAAGASGQYGNIANQDQRNAQATANQWAGIGNAVGTGTAAYGQYKKDNSDEE